MATHALTVGGVVAGAVAPGTKIGSTITLPAFGQWLIHDLLLQRATSDTINRQGSTGYVLVDPISGDLTPDPAPGRYPLPGQAPWAAANSGLVQSPIFSHQVAWVAPGKAQIDMRHIDLAPGGPGQFVQATIMFGEVRPFPRPMPFVDSVSADISANAVTLIGTITLAEKSKRITGIFADLALSAIPAVGDPIIGYASFESDDKLLTPLQIPFARAYGALELQPDFSNTIPNMAFIPVDIPTPNGMRITVTSNMAQAYANPVIASVFIAYE